MSGSHSKNYPKLHNAAWPGVVGKGPDSEPPIDLDTMIDMLVDNAIVVLENIFRHREDGLDGKQAALIGSQEVAVAITASTLTTIAVFVPVLFIQGMAAFASASCSRFLIDSRLSCSCLPLASASSTLILPFLKYIFVGTSV